MSFSNPNPATIDALIAARTKRQDILYQPGRKVQLVVGETALRPAPGAVDTLIEQLDRLVSLSELAAVELRVVPFPTMAATTLSCFGLYDDTLAWVETLAGERTLHDPDEVAVYVKAFELLRTKPPSTATL